MFISFGKLINQKENYCVSIREIATNTVESECGSEKANIDDEEANSDLFKENNFSGVTYKIGFRYHF